MGDAHLVDPLGRGLTLHEFTWVGHVLKRHPEMLPHRTLAEAAIRRPVAIHVSGYDPSCRTYYGQGPRPAIMIAVVADVVGGFVKTAFLTSRTKGVREW